MGDRLTGTPGVDDVGPFWGARVYPPTTGQDHLGLGSVSSDQILPMLSPGINVLTIHPRYWAFYSLILTDFWASDRPRTRAAFQAYYRPREAMFAVACQICPAPEHSTLGGNIVGTQRTQRMSANDNQFDPDVAYIKEALGGYGLYYRTVMENVGLLVRPDDNKILSIDAPTPAGQAVAAAYRDAVRGTEFYKDFWPTLQESVPRAVLRDFAAAACLCRLRSSEAFDLPLLRDVFLHEGPEPEPSARRATLRFFLDLAITPTSEAIDEDVFRQLIYFRRIGETEYTPSSGVRATAQHWRLYQAREYFAFNLNRLWAWLVRQGMGWTNDGLSTLPAADLRAAIVDAINSNTFTVDTGLPGQRVTADTPISELSARLSKDAKATQDLDASWARHPSLDEHALYRSTNNTVDDPNTLVACLSSLLLIQARIASPSVVALLDPVGRAIYTGGGMQRMGMSRSFDRLRRATMAGATVGETLCELVDQVITQHERVAVAKLPDDTFRFRRVGASLRFIGGATPVTFNDSRFRALSSTVHELGLVDAMNAPTRAISGAGEQLRTDGDLPRGALAAAITTNGAAAQP